ncbi:MAG: F0F1 ATP synthase subunit A [Opitutales bacterium]|nr:F0F1 ATP synthase subunit A [Opitutales bacterium]
MIAKWQSVLRVTIGGFLFSPAILSAEGLSPRAESAVTEGLGTYLTNSLLMGVLISLAIAMGIRLMTRRGIRMIPEKGQACIESVVEGLEGILEPIVGRDLYRQIFPLLLGYFVFIVIQNLSGLLPGVGSIWLNVRDQSWEIFRPMNADLNATLALALIANVAWLYYCIKCVGFRGLYEHNFGNKADKREVSSFVYQFLFIIFFGVGLVESLSILFRIVSLSFRLFGNIFGGENLLHNMYAMSEFLTSGGLQGTDFYQMLASVSTWGAQAINGLARVLGYFLPLPFYFLECLVGVVQAFVFTLLVAVYIGLICKHDEEGTAQVA